MCAKTIFNYLCWSNSVEFMLGSKFNVLKNIFVMMNGMIGYGSDVTVATPQNATSPVVGTMLNFNNGVCELLDLGK